MLSGGSPRPVRRTGLREEVYGSILEMLVQGDLEEGSALRVEALAQALGVSPTPVREALVQLESTGLITYVSNKGYSVSSDLTAEDIAEIMDARMVLEIAAAQRAARAGDASLVRRLKELVEQQRAIARRVVDGSTSERRDATREYLSTDHAFHDAIFRGSRNRYLVRLAAALDAQSQRARQAYRSGITDEDEALSEHEAICEAIAGGDPTQAEMAMRAHLERVLSKSLIELSETR